MYIKRLLLARGWKVAIVFIANTVCARGLVSQHYASNFASLTIETCVTSAGDAGRRFRSSGKPDQQLSRGFSHIVLQ